MVCTKITDWIVVVMKGSKLKQTVDLHHKRTEFFPLIEARKNPRYTFCFAILMDINFFNFVSHFELYPHI